VQTQPNCYLCERRMKSSIMHLLALAIALTSVSAGCGGAPQDGDDAGPASADSPSGDARRDAAEAGAPLPPSTMMTIPLTGCDPFYTASVTLGETQTFRLAVDTGSTTLAVAGKSCEACAEAGVTPLYQPGPSAIDAHRTASSRYDVGELGWTGEVYEDTVQVGGVDKAVTTEIAVMQSEMGLFQTNEPCGLGEGILGLGPTDASVSGTNGFFEQLVATGVPNVFAVELCGMNGYLWLGGYDPAHALAHPQFTPMVENELYAVRLSGVSVEGKSLEVSASAYGTGTTIVDTGGSLFFLPEPIFTALSAQIASDPAFQGTFGGADWFVAVDSCMPMTQTRAELDAMLPKLTVTFGASPEVSIQATATSSYLTPIPYMGKTYWCPGIGALPPGSIGAGVVADVGGALLHSNIVIFDRENRRVGFAPHASCQ
jgi:hypothetical protein